MTEAEIKRKITRKKRQRSLLVGRDGLNGFTFQQFNVLSNQIALLERALDRERRA